MTAEKHDVFVRCASEKINFICDKLSILSKLVLSDEFDRFITTTFFSFDVPNMKYVHRNISSETYYMEDISSSLRSNDGTPNFKRIFEITDGRKHNYDEKGNGSWAFWVCIIEKYAPYQNFRNFICYVGYTATL